MGISSYYGLPGVILLLFYPSRWYKAFLIQTHPHESPTSPSRSFQLHYWNPKLSLKLFTIIKTQKTNFLEWVFFPSFHFYSFWNQSFLSRRTAVKSMSVELYLPMRCSPEQSISGCLAHGHCQCFSHLQVPVCKTKWTKPNRKTILFSIEITEQGGTTTLKKYSKSGDLKISLCSKKVRPFKPFCFRFLLFQKADPHHTISQHPNFHLDFYQQFISASLKCTLSFNVRGAECSQQPKGKSSITPFFKLVPP